MMDAANYWALSQMVFECIRLAEVSQKMVFRLTQAAIAVWSIAIR